jgi:hypothetical protein
LKINPVFKNFKLELGVQELYQELEEALKLRLVVEEVKFQMEEVTFLVLEAKLQLLVVEVVVVEDLQEEEVVVVLQYSLLQD